MNDLWLGVLGSDLVQKVCRMSRNRDIGTSVSDSSACIGKVYQHRFRYTILNVWAYDDIPNSKVLYVSGICKELLRGQAMTL